MALLFATLLSPAAAPAQATADPCAGSRGPLSIVNETPLRHPFLRPTPRSACPLEGPTVEARGSVENHFQDARDGERWARIDAETYRLDLAAALPLSGGRDIRVEVPFRIRAEGLLDGPIEAWHSALGFPEGTRPDYARGRVGLLVGADEPGGRGLLLFQQDPGSGFGDVTVALRQVLPHLGDAGRAAVTATVELPTGDVGELRGNGDVDVGLGVAASSRAGDAVWVHWNADLVRLGGEPLAAGLHQATTITRMMAAVEWRATPATHLLAQALLETSPLGVGVELLDREALLVAVGVRQALPGGLELEVGFGEDVRVQTAPDVALQAGLRWSPRPRY